MLASDIPTDVWIHVSSHVKNPKDHIALSKICHSSRAPYLDDTKWKQMCLSLGIGRPVSDKREWKIVLASVLKHRRRCKLPRCFQFALPPSTAIGDLLTTPKEVMEHTQYFKNKYPCTCGAAHSDDEEDEEDDSDEDDENDEEDEDEDEDDEDEDDSDEDSYGDESENADDGWLIGQNIANSADPNDPDPADLMATLMQQTFMSLMGHPPPDGMYGNSRSRKSKPKPAPKPRAHLLPLSWKNREQVPHHPALHPLLGEFGSVQFQHFLFGRMALQPYSLALPENTMYPAQGVDWDETVDLKGEARDPTLADIYYHPFLLRAFATNPPVTELRIEISPLHTKVVNEDGVTISDFITHLRTYLTAPLSTDELVQQCAAWPHPGCHLEKERNRATYVLRYYPSPQPMPEKRINRVRQCFMTGGIRIDKGEVVCVLTGREK